MAAIAANPAFAKKANVPQSVGQEFVKADQGRKFSEGGTMKNGKMEMKHAMAMKKAGLPKKMVKEEMAEAKAYAKGGFTSSADGIAKKGKTKAKQIMMASGGSCGMARKKMK